MLSLSQERSKFALEQLLNKKEEIKKMDKGREYKSFVAGVPAMILQNGLGQTLAFMLAKKDEKKHIMTFDIIKDWLIHKGFIDGSIENRHDFMLKISELDQSQYLLIQEETLALLEWVKRYASSLAESK